jgi:hypothetical protein
MSRRRQPSETNNRTATVKIPIPRKSEVKKWGMPVEKNENNNIKHGCYKKPVGRAPPAPTQAQSPPRKVVWLVTENYADALRGWPVFAYRSGV